MVKFSLSFLKYPMGDQTSRCFAFNDYVIFTIIGNVKSLPKHVQASESLMIRIEFLCFLKQCLVSVIWYCLFEVILKVICLHNIANNLSVPTPRGAHFSSRRWC